MKKVIIYCRVSNKKQTIYGLSIEDQEYRLLQFCKQRGWEVVEVIREIFPAKTFKKRNHISRIINEMQNKTISFDTILCVSFDRFSRDVASAQEVMHILMSSKIELHTLDKRYNLNTVQGRREYVADAWRAQDDNMSRAAKAESGIKQRIRNGDSPFRVGNGYKKISGNRHKDPLKRTESKTVFDEKTVHIYQEAFALVASGAYSGEGARKYLKERYAMKIQKQTFYNILKNPYYMGYLIYTNEEGIRNLVKGNHPAMVSEATWHLVQEKLLLRSRKVLLYKKRNPDYPLKGFLLCPSCERKLTAGKSKSGNGCYHHYYNCQRKTSPCCFNLTVQYAHKIFEDHLKLYKFPNVIKQVYREVLKSTFNINDSDTINRISKIRDLQNDSELNRIELINLLMRKKIEQEEYDLMIKQLKTEKESLQAELIQLESRETSYEAYSKSNSNMMSDINAFFWSSSIDCQNELLDALLDTGIVMDKTKIISLKYNANFKLLLN